MKTPMTPQQQARFFRLSCSFEAGLILVAYALAALAGIDPSADLLMEREAVSWGILGTIPLYALFILFFDQLKITGLQRIKRLLIEVLGTALVGCRWHHLLILAILAGVSEELLFRGVLQPWLESLWGPAAGLIVSSLLFGLVHFITPLYALLAALTGLYLGLMLDIGEHRNLLTPMIIHGFYDFLAFIAIINATRSELDES